MMRQNVFSWATAALLAVALSFSASLAHADEDPETMLRSLSDRAMGVMRASDIDPEKRSAEIRQVLRDGFNVEAIGRFVLGRYWRSANDQDREQFIALFEDFIVETFSSRFKEYADQEFAVTGSQDGAGGSTSVFAEIRSPNGSTVKTEWKMRSFADRYQIIDVLVEGVSLSVTQRSEFATVAQREGGITGLIKILEQKVEELRNEASKSAAFARPSLSRAA